MLAWTIQLLSNVMAWLAIHPALSTIVLLSFQAALVIAISDLIIKFACRNNPIAEHRVWLATMALTLVIIPIHASRCSWQINVSAITTGTTRSNAATMTKPIALVNETDIQGQEPTQEPIAELQVAGETQTEVKSSELATTASMPLLLRDTPSSRFQENIPSSQFLLCALGIVYVVVVFVLFARVMKGTVHLLQIASKAKYLSNPHTSSFEQLSRRVGLSKTPYVKSSESIAMPFVFGVHFPLVLVPSNFETWSRSDQEAVLLHEFMHIKRLDCFWEFLIRVMQIVYWFHPGCWYLTKRLHQSRELATDRGVIELGTNAKQYANSLLAVIAQNSKLQRSHFLNSGITIPMSAIGSLEDRLSSILSSSMYPKRKGILRASMFLLMLVTVATTIRLELANAQTNPKPQAQSTVNADEKQAPQSVAESPRQVNDEYETDFFKIVRDCKVNSVDGDENSITFNFSGKVVNAAGKPVANAIVVLREESARRSSLNRKPNDPLDRWDYLTERLSDVFAKTTTDVEGNYRFKDIHAPKLNLPNRYEQSWDGGLVVVHESEGAGFTSLRFPVTEKNFLRSGVNVELSPPSNVSGTCLTQDGKPVAGALVSLRLQKVGGRYRSSPEGMLNLFHSQLQPRAVSKQDGTFEFRGLPSHMISILDASHREELLDGITAVATSSDVQQKSVSMMGEIGVVHSPAKLQMEPRVVVTGVVTDETDQPVASARVSINSNVPNVLTDEAGQFRIDQPALLVKFMKDQHEIQKKRVATRKPQSGSELPLTCSVVVQPPEQTEYLVASYAVPVDDLIAKKPLQLKLKKGVRVTGKVILENGTPVAKATVSNRFTRLERGTPVVAHHSKPATTNDQGEYEIYLPPGMRHTLFVGSEEAGYSLPSALQLATATPDQSRHWPQQSIDLTDDKSTVAKPIIVSKLPSYEVNVTYTGGRPAIGASVRLRDEQSARSGPSRIVAKSFFANEQGRASLALQRVPIGNPWIEASLIDGQRGFYGRMNLVDLKTGKVNLQLEDAWLIQGRVFVDGKPVADAELVISMRRDTSKVDGNVFIPSSTSIQFDVARTQKDGSYQVAVPRDKVYEVNLRSIPGHTNDDFSCYAEGRPNSEGIISVPDMKLITAKEEIHGMVVDENDTPIEGLRVSIEQFGDINPGTLIGYMKSNFVTDAEGRFALQALPPGEHTLLVFYPPRNEPDKNGRITYDPVKFRAKAGDKKVRLKIKREI